MAVAECVYGNAAGQVDVLAPFGIPYAAALSAFGDDGGEGEVGGQVVLHDAVRVFCRYGRGIMRCLASGFNVQAV